MSSYLGDRSSTSTAVFVRAPYDSRAIERPIAFSRQQDSRLLGRGIGSHAHLGLGEIARGIVQTVIPNDHQPPDVDRGVLSRGMYSTPEGISEVVCHDGQWCRPYSMKADTLATSWSPCFSLSPETWISCMYELSIPACLRKRSRNLRARWQPALNCDT